MCTDNFSDIPVSDTPDSTQVEDLESPDMIVEEVMESKCVTCV